MKKIFSLLVLFTITVNAQVSEEKVHELINAMQADKMISKTIEQMIPVMQQQLKSSLKTEEQKQKAEKINSIVIEESKTFTKNIVNGPMIEVYAKHFNEKDINYMIDFYKSKTGAKLLELTPTITKELMEKMMKEELPKFQENVKSRIQQLKNSVE